MNSKHSRHLAISINDAWCKGCNICVAFCPKAVFEKGYPVPVISAPYSCNGCRMCELRCPDYAIAVEDGKDF